MEPQHARPERGDRPRRRAVGEHRREQRADELVGRQIGQHQCLLETLRNDVGREGAGPSGVRRREDQRPGDGGMVAVERERERGAERQPGHVRLLEAEPLDEAGQAVGVGVDAERFRRIR
jgi:hypothetical protein